MKNTSVKTLGLSKAYDNKIILQDVSLELSHKWNIWYSWKKWSRENHTSSYVNGFDNSNKG